MKMNLKYVIGKIRSFNRYYTNVLGLLDQHILKSDLSFSEVRVLHEIDKTEQCTSSILADVLCLDAGYLSRILKKFTENGLLKKEKISEDAREKYLYLTAEGKEKMAVLNSSSDQQIAQLIKPLEEIHRKFLLQNMVSIETMLKNGDNIELNDITIRSDIHPGDIGYIIYMHGWIYMEEYGYSPLFEGYVAESLSEFIRDFDPGRDRLWCAEHCGQIIGCIGIVSRGERAQLRWFLLNPFYRGIGLGRKLLRKSLDFAGEKNFKSVYLHTTDDLDKAISMYTKTGFVKVSQKRNNSWREDLTEIEFEMELG